MADVEFLLKLHNKLHERSSLLSMWQELADNYYPERADFTTTMTLGTDYASHLMTSYPIMVRRDFGNSLGSMLRPSSIEWFQITAGSDDGDEDVEGKAWLSEAGEVQRKLMYEPSTNFTRATKAGDHDYATFGQCVIQVHFDWSVNRLCYQSWHLRDTAWQVDRYGNIDVVSRKWRPTCRELIEMFGEENCSREIPMLEKKDSFATVECVHMIVPASMCKGEKEYKTKFVSLYIDVANKKIMEEVGSRTKQYVIPRWELVGGSQYAISPAATIALPDARQLQMQARILIEAGEKAVDPPIVSSRNIGREGWNLYAGGITFHELEAGEHIRDQMMMATNDKTGIPIGLEMQQDTRELLRAMFYLDKLTMPIVGPEKTAYEAGLIHQEHIRQALPLFEPIEADYNGQLCEETFEQLLPTGAFGSLMDMPESLAGKQIRFKFRSPLHDAVEKIKATKFMEAKGILAEAIPMDQNVQYDFDVRKAARQALAAVGDPEWMRSEDDANKMAGSAQQQRQAQELLATMQQGADVAKTLSESGAMAGA